jgi:hypothetical protein
MMTKVMDFRFFSARFIAMVINLKQTAFSRIRRLLWFLGHVMENIVDIIVILHPFDHLVDLLLLFRRQLFG